MGEASGYGNGHRLRPPARPAPSAGAALPVSGLRWLIFAAVASGQAGYRQLARFGRAHAGLFTDLCNRPHGLPSHVRGRALRPALDTPAVRAAVQAALPPPPAGAWLAGNGPALRATTEVAHGPGPRYCARVSRYCQHTGLPHAGASYRSHQTHEGQVLRTLRAGLRAADGGALVLTREALHRPKKPSTP